MYYVVAITLAYALKDNRAFCKYVCPIPVLQKIPSRFSLMKVEGDAEKCNGCGACDRICPMDIQVSQYTQANKRVLSSECILCNECIDVCNQEALDFTFGFDFGKEEFSSGEVENDGDCLQINITETEKKENKEMNRKESKQRYS